MSRSVASFNIKVWRRGDQWLCLLAGISALLYGWVASCSFSFGRSVEPGTPRPIVLVLMLLAVLFALYLAAIWIARRSGGDWRTIRNIVGAAILFRLIMLPSVPILEIDIYRYLWDGAVALAGVSPYRYPPRQVRETDAVLVEDPDLRRLVRLRERHPSLAQILDRIHYAELPTVYPPVSQVVFAAAVLSTPDRSNVLTYIIVMKAWLILFDLLTIWVIARLLRLGGLPGHFIIVYAWCPLLIKEVANTGHLDAIAVFFTTLTVYFLARLLHAAHRSSVRVRLRDWLASAVTFAFAIGAKLYPAVLAPLFAALLLRSTRPRQWLAWGLTAMASTAVLLWPMVYAGDVAADPTAGLRAFVQRWEMNDFLFMLVVENLQPDGARRPPELPWFVFVPNGWRTRLAMLASPFLVARGATAVLFLVIAGALAFRTFADQGTPQWRVRRFAEAAFLTLAWFWLLAPTQNPWYWTWALPLVVFAGNCCWWLISGIVFTYYLRFWFGEHFGNTTVLGTRYTGTRFFDFVVTWIEFGPWLMLLGATWWLKRQRRGREGVDPPANNGLHRVQR